MKKQMKEKYYPEPEKLYHIDNDKAFWPKDAEDYIWWSSEGDDWSEDYAKAYRVKISPFDFLDLTTERGASNLDYGDAFFGGELRDLDIDEFNKERHQPMFLQITFRDKNRPYRAQVVGHEGRHRMFALMKAGVKEVDIELRCMEYDTHYDKYKPIEHEWFQLVGQFNHNVVVQVYNPIPMSWKRHKEMRPEWSKETFLEKYNITSIDKFPKFLYHATYEPYLKEIISDGKLAIKRKHYNWGYDEKWDTKDVIYLASDYDAAYSFAETAEAVNDELLDQIVVLEIPVSELDLDYLDIDSNNRIEFESGTNEEDKYYYQTYEYGKDIPFSICKVIRENNYINESKQLNEYYETDKFELGTCGYIKDDGTLIILDEYHGEEDAYDLIPYRYPEFSNTHPEEDTCVRLWREPTPQQAKRLEQIIDIYLDREGYCKAEIWAGSGYQFYKVFSLWEGACSDYQWDEYVGNWTGYKIVTMLKNHFKKFEDLNESILLEKTRNELIAKSKKSDNYSAKNQYKGKNRWERRIHSRVANTVRDYNKIDMDAFFKADILDFIIKVQGETNNYEVQITFEEALREIANEIKKNNNKLEFKSILRGLIASFNRGNVYVGCNCLDFTYRQSYWATKGQYNSGMPQPSNGKEIANPNDTKGAGCKHVNLVLANLDWMMKIASVINNYIYYARDNLELLYAKHMFPKLYGMPYDKAIQLTFDMYDENGNLKDDAALDTSEDIINMSNMLGAKRTQYKKKPEKSVNRRSFEIEVDENDADDDIEM